MFFSDLIIFENLSLFGRVIHLNLLVDEFQGKITFSSIFAFEQGIQLFLILIIILILVMILDFGNIIIKYIRHVFLIISFN